MMNKDDIKKKNLLSLSKTEKYKNYKEYILVLTGEKENTFNIPPEKIKKQLDDFAKSFDEKPKKEEKKITKIEESKPIEIIDNIESNDEQEKEHKKVKRIKVAKEGE